MRNLTITEKTWIRTNCFVGKNNTLKPRVLKFIATENIEISEILAQIQKIFPNASNSEIILRALMDNFKPFTCKLCGKIFNRYISTVKNGFPEFCSKKCSAIVNGSSEESRKKAQMTNLERRGVLFPLQSTEVKDKQMKTNLQRYGVENISQLQETQDKIKRNSLEKYGVEHSSKLDSVKEKHKTTCLEKYGVEHHLKIPFYMDKQKQTNLERYGVKFQMQRTEVQDAIKQTCLERYGVENISQLQETKDKVKQANLDRYGVEYYSQLPEVKDSMKKKSRETCREKYGSDIYEHSEHYRSRLPEILEKQRLTKIKNGTSSSSKYEEEMFILLKEKFTTVLRQYKSEVYPYACDFYIPEKDLYIEFQGHWSHGQHPFDATSEEDRQLAQSWREKAKELNFQNKPKKMYEIAAKTWTIKDVKKREAGSKINWIEFFTIDKFKEWLENYG